MTFKKILTLFLGNTLASFAITMIIKSGLGCFSVSAANIALANWTGLSIGVTGMILELILLLIATYKGEGIGLTAIVNATYGSLIIDLFLKILPSHPSMIVGILIVPVAWSIMGRAGLGDTGSNILMNALVKSTKKSLGFIRCIQECVLFIVGFLGARENITIVTVILTLGLGHFLQFAYKLLRYEPTKVEHRFLIKGHRGC